MQSGPAAGGQAFNSPQYAAGLAPAVLPVYLDDGAYNFYFPNNLLNTSHNPVASARENVNQRPQTIVNAQGWFQINRLQPWLRFRSTNTLRYSLTRVHRYLHSEFGTGILTSGALTERDNHARRITSTNLFTANKNWGGRHRLTAVAGVEIENQWTTFNQLTVVNFATNDKPSGSMGSQVSSWTGGGSGYSLFSAISTADYSYQNRYFASGSYRMDASSRFHPDHRVGNFWSVSGAWRISNEQWFRPYVKYVNSLRMRASYGINGTLPSERYYWRSTYHARTYAGESGAAQLIYPQEDLTWEGNRIWNIAMDARILSSRFRLTLEYFDRQSRDLLQAVPVTSTTGVSTMLMNTDAGINNRGLEMEISGMAFEKGKHSLDFNFNFATLKSTYYGLTNQELDPNNMQIMANGQNVHTWFMREYAGIDPETGLSLFVNTNPIDGSRYLATTVDNALLALKGQGIPKISGGFSTTYTYGGLSLNVLCSYGLGHYIYDRLSRGFTNTDGASERAISSEALGRWTPDNIYATAPLRYNGNAPPSHSTRFLKKGDYLKIRTVRLQYAIPDKISKMLKLADVSVYVQAENPYILSHIPDYDPEMSVSGIRHMDRYPTTSTYVVGVNVKF